jgi:hypothetical protein
MSKHMGINIQQKSHYRVLIFSTNSFGTEVLILDHSEIQFLLFCNLLYLVMLSRNRLQ